MPVEDESSVNAVCVELEAVALSDPLCIEAHGGGCDPKYEPSVDAACVEPDVVALSDPLCIEAHGGGCDPKYEPSAEAACVEPEAVAPSDAFCIASPGGGGGPNEAFPSPDSSELTKLARSALRSEESTVPVLPEELLLEAVVLAELLLASVEVTVPVALTAPVDPSADVEPPPDCRFIRKDCRSAISFEAASEMSDVDVPALELPALELPSLDEPVPDVSAPDIQLLDAPLLPDVPELLLAGGGPHGGKEAPFALAADELSLELAWDACSCFISCHCDTPEPLLSALIDMSHPFTCWNAFVFVRARMRPGMKGRNDTLSTTPPAANCAE